MKAITLWQPWASMVAAGEKTVETRCWQTPYRGRLAIHAAKYVVPNLPQDLRDRAEFVLRQRLDEFPRGAVVAIVNLYEVVRTEDYNPSAFRRVWGDFAPGRWAWKFTHIVAIDPPIPARGQQGMWEWNEVGYDAK